MQNHAKRQFNNNNASVMAAISIGAMLIFSVAGTKAFAQDKVVNDINASVGSVTITAGQTTQVSYKIIAQKESTDPKPGSPDCNPELDPVTIALNIPTDVTANPTSLDFNQCNVFKDVDFTSTVPGTYTIRVQDAGTEYDEAPATFTLIVKAATPPADETNPTISITSPNDGDTITEDSVTVSGTASDSGSGLAKVEVKVGNSGSYSAASGTSTWSAQVTLADGENTITAQATDNAGNSATDSVTVTYTPPDETAPILEVPTTPLTAEATGPDGAKVSYDVSATDDRDPSPKITCTPASGSTFPLGTTEVTCTATDAAGNDVSKSFSVTVQDTTAPTLELPSLDPIEATGPNGAIVTYTATAKDLVDGSFAASCTPASGTAFALGSTTVTCNAQDEAGNNAEPGTFSVTVQDTTAPKLTVPTDMSTTATGADGAKVTYTATATDAVDTDPTVTCTPASGSTFPVGTTTVSCTATDDSGNTSPAATFKVSVTLTMAGFYQPVDMGSTINTVKGGSTVPFKFEIFAGSKELTSTTFNGNPIGVFTAKKVACPGGAAEDPIEQVVTATGGTALRYDATSGQFVYNWQTPKTPVGACYDTTFTVTADGSTLTAHFKTK